MCTGKQFFILPSKSNFRAINLFLQKLDFPLMHFTKPCGLLMRRKGIYITKMNRLYLFFSGFWLYYHERVDVFIKLLHNGLFQKISPPLWTTLNWVPKTFRISKKYNRSLCRIPNPADSKSWGIPEFRKTLNGFSGIPVKINKILEIFMEFQSDSPSIYYRISNVVHWGYVDIFWNSPVLTNGA